MHKNGSFHPKSSGSYLSDERMGLFGNPAKAVGHLLMMRNKSENDVSVLQVILQGAVLVGFSVW